MYNDHQWLRLNQETSLWFKNSSNKESDHNQKNWNDQIFYKWICHSQYLHFWIDQQWNWDNWNYCRSSSDSQSQNQASHWYQCSKFERNEYQLSQLLFNYK